MVRIENHCCGCAAPSYPCLGSSCPLRSVPVHYCDKCGAEMEDHEVLDDGDDICESCLEEMEEEQC